MTTNLRQLIAASLLIVVYVPALSVGTEFFPSKNDIAGLERAIRLPEGSAPLAKYRRFYAGEVDGGRHTVMAVLQLDPSGGGIEIVHLAHLPLVYDGGCSFIAVRYEIESRVFKSVKCNGAA